MDDSAGQENEEIGGAVRVAVRSQYSSALILLSFSALPFASIHG